MDGHLNGCLGKPMLNRSKLVNVLIGSSLEAVGAGVEMWSREKILAHLSAVLTGYQQRGSEFGKGYIIGDYTDDFEMTLAVLFVMREAGDKVITIDQLYEHWRRLFNETETYKDTGGAGRAGYGSLSAEILEWNANGKQAFLQRLQDKWNGWSERPADRKVPGNASLMRMSPLVCSPTTELMIENAIVNGLATAPHPFTVITCVLLAFAGRYMVDDGHSEGVIKYALARWKERRDDVARVVKTLRMTDGRPFWSLTVFREWTLVEEEILTKLEYIDTMKQPPDVFEVYNKGDLKFDPSTIGKPGPDPIDGIDYWWFENPYARPLKGGTGLAARQDRTLYCALFCLKWSGSASMWGNIVRCIMFGGDTDTLIACVMPYIYRHARGFREIPRWVWDNLEMYDPKYQKRGFDLRVYESLIL